MYRNTCRIRGVRRQFQDTPGYDVDTWHGFDCANILPNLVWYKQKPSQHRCVSACFLRIRQREARETTVLRFGVLMRVAAEGHTTQLNSERRGERNEGTGGR